MLEGLLDESFSPAGQPCCLSRRTLSCRRVAGQSRGAPRSAESRLNRRFYEDFPATSYLLLIIVGFFALELLAIHKLVEPEDLRGFPMFFGGKALVPLHLLGALDTESVVASHEYWRLFTAIVLHGGVIHLLFNLLILFDLGRFCESTFSSTKYFTFFVICGLSGSLTRWAWSAITKEPALSLGASGALLGLIGVCFSYSIKERQVEMRQYFVRWLIQIAILSLLLRGVVDHAAHLGGFVAGFALGFTVDRYTTSESAARWRIPAWTAGAVFGAALLYGLVHYFRNLADLAR